jgi:malonyl-CoA O-methyltransferase
MNKPAKARIRLSFERAAPTYDGAAEIQRQICCQLAESLPTGLHAKLLLDAGCGTGYALDLLHKRFPEAQLIALDFAPAMLARITNPCQRLVGDLEHLPLAAGSVDLYWSSLAVQWCALPTVLAEASRVLKAQGQIAIASLGPQTFHELRHAFAAVDAHQHTLNFHSVDEITRLAHSAGFITVNVESSPKTAHYPDFKSLLLAVKAIGANQLGSGRRSGLMSRSAFAQAEAACEALRTESGLPLTYDVITLTAQR